MLFHALPLPPLPTECTELTSAAPAGRVGSVGRPGGMRLITCSCAVVMLGMVAMRCGDMDAAGCEDMDVAERADIDVPARGMGSRWFMTIRPVGSLIRMLLSAPSTSVSSYAGGGTEGISSFSPFGWDCEGSEGTEIVLMAHDSVRWNGGHRASRQREREGQSGNHRRARGRRDSSRFSGCWGLPASSWVW